MRAPSQQRPRRAHHFAPTLLDANTNLHGVRGLRCTSAWFVSARTPRRQALDRLHARNSRDQ